MVTSLKNRSGAALVTVLVALLIISLMILELQYSSMIERKLAMNELNQIQAYYLAKSGIRIGMLRVALFSRARRDPRLAAIPGFDKSKLEMIWRIPLPAFPPPKGSLSKLNKKDKDAAEKVLEETKISDGQFSQTISSEGSKINLNYFILPKDKQNTAPNLSAEPSNLMEYNARLLINLINEFIRNSENPADEFGNLKPEELVLDIMDWVNPGNSRLAGGGKDSFYEQQNPPYRAKRGPFFTIEELRLVRGIDDNLYGKLKPYVTVYSDQGKVNLNSANDTLLKAILPSFTEYDLRRLSEEKARIGGTWPSEKAFVDFIVQNLGRTGTDFKDTYKKEEDYPFTVNNYSFVIDSLGTIQKSKASVQRSIKVAVALTQGRGGELVPSVLTEADCNKNPAYFWYLAAGPKCFSKPKSESDCRDKLAGTWLPDPANNNQQGCKLNNQGFIAPIKAATGSDPKSVPEPDTMKVLYWYEA